MSTPPDDAFGTAGRPSPFRRPAYRQWYLASTLLAISTSMTLAVTLALVDVTGDIATAGVISGLIIAAELLAGMLGGGLADVISRRRLLYRALTAALIANTLLAFLLAALALTDSTGQAWITGAVVVSLVVSAGAAGIADPVIDASARSLIEPAEFPRAMSAEQARSSTLQILGSPASGSLYALAPSAPFLLRVLCDLGFVMTLGRIRQDLGPGPETVGSPEAKTPVREVTSRALLGYRQAITFLVRHRALRRVLVSAPLVNLMVFSGTSWTVLHLTAAGVDPLTTGIASAGFAVGGLLGSAAAPALTDRVAPGILAIMGLTWMTAAFAVLFLCEGRPWLIFVTAVVAMFPSPALNGGLFGHVFGETPADMQGRVMATFGLVGGLAAVLAPPLAGIAVQGGHHAALGAITCGIGVLGVLVLVTSTSVRGMPRP